MRCSFYTTVLLSVALSSLAAPVYVVEESLALRSEELWSRNPPDDWSNIPHTNKIENTGSERNNRLKPAPGVTDTHITYKKGGDKETNPPVHVQHYQVWKPPPPQANKAPGAMASGGRWRGNDDVGKTHGGIEPPIWHPGPGEVKGNKGYKATDRQNPPSYDLAKFSKSLNSKMPAAGSPSNTAVKAKDDTALNKGKSKVGPVVTGKKGSKSI